MSDSFVLLPRFISFFRIVQSFFHLVFLGFFNVFLVPVLYLCMCYFGGIAIKSLTAFCSLIVVPTFLVLILLCCFIIGLFISHCQCFFLECLVGCKRKQTCNKK